VAGVLLNSTDIRGYLQAVADALPPDGPQHVIIMVGGSLLTWHGLRDTTRDVDSVHRMDDELKAAVAVVAGVHGLAPAWLNDNSAIYAPVTLKLSDCEVLLEHPRMLVRGAPLRQVFLMKVFAARARTSDRDDLVIMWPQIGYTPQEAADAFREAYPADPEDPYLIGWIEHIAAEAD